MKILFTVFAMYIISSFQLTYAGKPEASLQDHASIIEAVKHFLEQHIKVDKKDNITIDINNLDKRLFLKKCSEALQTFYAPGSNKSVGKTTVGVRCNTPHAWAIYVPATVNQFATVYKTAKYLNKGHVIGEGDIQAISYNLATLNYGYFTDKSQLIGLVTKRKLSPNRVITANQVKEPLLVKRGDQVALVAKSSKFSIKMKGKSLMNGAKGDRIRVKNLSSNRVIEGTVTQNAEVTVFN